MTLKPINDERDADPPSDQPSNHGPGGLVLRERSQRYCVVTRRLSTRMFEGLCYEDDGSTITRLCMIPKSMEFRVYLHKGDLVLISIRDIQEDKCDFIHRYTSSEARNIRRYENLPDRLQH